MFLHGDSIIKAAPHLKRFLCICIVELPILYRFKLSTAAGNATDFYGSARFSEIRFSLFLFYRFFKVFNAIGIIIKILYIISMTDSDTFGSGEFSIEAVDAVDYDIPPNGRVIFFNDDYTTKDFVVDVLMSVFYKSEEDACVIMESVHKTGSAIVGVYAFDIAATRAALAVRRAREQGFPLKVEVQEV